MITTLTISEIFDAVMAADGVWAALDREGERITVITDDLSAALTVLLPQAVAFVADHAGDAVSDYAVTAKNVTFTHPDNLAIATALLTATAWRLLQLCYVGANAQRADRCTALAAAALPTHATPPLLKPSHIL